jgi:acyl-CoA thioesterase FadM
VAIQTEVRRASPRLVEFTYVLSSAETGLKLATGSTTHVFCGRDLRPTRLPEKYRGAFGIS